MKAALIALGAFVALMFVATATPALAAGGHAPTVCLDGTAPEGWQRPGGFCELAAKGPDTTSRKSAPPPPPALPS